MNLPRVHSLGLALLAAMATTQAGEFMNLGFDSPQFPENMPAKGVELTVEQAIPNWSVDVGGYPNKSVFYRDRRLGSPGVTLMEHVTGPAKVDFYVLLESGGWDAHLYQVGWVPEDTRILTFKAGFRPDAITGAEAPSGAAVAEMREDSASNLPLFTVSLGGETLALEQAGGLYSADIGRWSGGTHELRFSAHFLRTPIVIQGYLFLDDIRFSNVSVIPEPTTVTLLSLGILGLGWRLRKPRA